MKTITNFCVIKIMIWSMIFVYKHKNNWGMQFLFLHKYISWGELLLVKHNMVYLQIFSEGDIKLF